jgi:hypothetical protein
MHAVADNESESEVWDVTRESRSFRASRLPTRALNLYFLISQPKHHLTCVLAAANSILLMHSPPMADRHSMQPVSAIIISSTEFANSDSRSRLTPSHVHQ